MSSLRTFHETLSLPDQTEMVCYTACPDRAGFFPAVILFQEIFGVNAHIREVCERLAQAGYLAVAPDIFHRTHPGFEAPYSDLAAGRAEAAKLTPEGLNADFSGLYHWLQHHPHVAGDRIGALGFCLGGRLSFLANAALPLKATVSFYGSGIAEQHLDQVAHLHAPQLLIWAGRDAWISAESIQRLNAALRAADKPFVNVEFSQADHGFLCDARSPFEPAAAAQAWALTLAFLDSHLVQA
jgi:carboxymethylenebutenolidase